MTVFDVVRALPDISTVRDRSRSMAMLDAILSPEWQYRYFSFDSGWSPGQEMASMRDGSGSDYSIVFAPAGAWARGFDHESPVSPFRSVPPTLWPGLIDTVPAVFDAQVAEPAFADADGGTLRATVCFWRETSDSEWRCGPVDVRVAGYEDADSADWLFELLVEGSAEAYRDFAEEYFEAEVELSAVRHVYDLLPLNREVVAALNPEVDLNDLVQDVAEIGYPV
ncbi:MAG: hypothetical protein JF587_09570 [Catenulisporales bacterium]|nr:hypothetical protein [Catenulisporales bacterium]